MLVFVLRRAALVEFVVVEVAPDCRRVGRFRVVGRRGVNRVRFRGHIRRKALRPGTYRITARTLPRGRALIDTGFVVVRHPQRDEIASARSADACHSSLRGQAASSATPGSATPRPDTNGEVENATRPSRGHGVLGTKFAKAGVDAVKSIPPWLFALLGLAIALLAVSALPPKATPAPGAAVTLAHHRGVVALSGAAVMVATVIVYALL